MMVYYFRKALCVLHATWKSQPDQNIAVRTLTSLTSKIIHSQINSLSVIAIHTTSVLLPSSLHIELCSVSSGFHITAALCPFVLLLVLTGMTSSEGIALGQG